MRLEFSRATLREAKTRANGRCEIIECQAVLKQGEGEGDHITPCALGGDNSLSNCQIICRVCHKAKSAKDIVVIRKADRQRDRHTGAMPKSSRPMPGSRNTPYKRTIDGRTVLR